MKSERKCLLENLCLMLAVLVAYLPAIQGGFIWDDDFHILANQNLRNLDGLRRIWVEPTSIPQYYPLVHTTFWLEYQSWKLEPLGYHLDNVLLHGLNAILLCALLRRLRVPGAWFAGLIFGLHPVHVESVAWITERKNVLSAFFYLCSLGAYLSFAPLDETASPSLPRQRRFYLLAFFFFFAALLSKTVTCTLPAVLLLLAWWKRGQISRREGLALSPFFCLGIVMGLTTSWLEKHHVGAMGEEWRFSAIDRMLIAGRALWFYVGKLVWPQELTFIYPRWSIDSTSAWQYLFPVGVVAVLASLWRLRGSIGRGPITAALIFSGSLFPALGFINFYPMRFSFVADHFQYLASAPLISLFAIFASTTLVRWLETLCLGKPLELSVSSQTPLEGECVGRPGIGERVRLKLLPGFAGAILLAMLGMLTWKQGYCYRNLETLWRHVIENNPSCAMARLNLGVALTAEGKLSEATLHYQQLLQTSGESAEVLSNLGDVLLTRGRADESIVLYERATRLKPDNAQIHYNFATALFQQKRFGEAFDHCSTALRWMRDYPEAHCLLGRILVVQNRSEEAMAHYHQALHLKPQYADACFQVGLLLAAQDRPIDAIRFYQAAIQYNPTMAEAHYNLGISLMARGMLDEAAAQYALALALKPDYAMAHNNLGTILLLRGKINEAIAHLSKALHLQPDLVEAHANLAQVLLKQGRVEEALHHDEEVVRLRSDSVLGYIQLSHDMAMMGRFKDAEMVSKRALELARSSKQKELIRDVQELIRQYHSRQ